MSRYTARTRMVAVNPSQPEAPIITTAGEIIRNGGLVAFPTETVYGLGANALDGDAVARIFSAKGRPSNDPIIAHIASIDQLDLLAVDVPPIAYKLAGAFWPGALTLILRKHPDVPMTMTAKMETLAVRMPAHPVAIALIEAAQTPIGAPSANLFSRPSPTTAAHVNEDLKGHVDMILDGGPTTIGVESTIVNLSAGIPAVLRPGGVSIEALRAYIPNIEFIPTYLEESVEAAPSPGTLIKHYSPKARVMLFDGEGALHMMRRTAENLVMQGESSIGMLLLSGDIPYFADLHVQVADLGDDVDTAARQLFAGMRQLDSKQVDVMLVRTPEKHGVGLALWDRLVRAAEGQVIEALEDESETQA